MNINKGEIVAIIRGVKHQYISSVIQTLLDEGISSVEVSLSEEEEGISCIKKIAEDFGDKVQLGAGTVINEKQVDKAIEAGATFILTPGWDTVLTRYIKSKKLEIFPGVFSPSEIMQSINEQIDVIKLFPAGNLGISYIKNLFGPFPRLKIMAVGGVNKENIQSFYNAGCYCFGIGSDLVPRGADMNSLNHIKASAREYLELLKGRC